MNEQLTIEDCNSVIVGFERGRFVIVRRDMPQPLLPVGCHPDRIRDLRPGDKVVYGGRLQAVRSVEVFD